MAPPVKKGGRRDSGRPERPPRREPEARPSSALIYGVLPVLEALRARTRRIDKVIIAEGAKEHRLADILDLCRARSIAWNYIPKESFARQVEPGVNHQGIAAFLASASYVTADDILAKAKDPALLI